MESETNQSEKVKEFYEKAFTYFSDLIASDEDTFISDQISLQMQFRQELIKLNIQVKKQPKSHQKTEELQKCLKEDTYKSMSPHYFCLETNHMLNNFKPEDCRAFKSAMAPLLLTFYAARTAQQGSETVNENTLYRVIFKNGDDLRQDQLILQIISLMDDLLKNVNIDLKLTPYKVMAWGKSDGVLECVQASRTLQEVLQKYNNNMDLFFKELARKTVNDPNSWYFNQAGMNPEEVKKDLEDKTKFAKYEEQIYHKIVDNYIDSCAGYCVITYILGIGDRHLENLMLTESGKHK